MVKAFADLRSGNKRYAQMLTYLQGCLFVAQITDNHDMLFWLEKILIQLIGYYDLQCRDTAVILLNSLYDGNDWQQKAAFTPVIRSVGQHFKISLSINLANFDTKLHHLFLGVSAPSPLLHSNDSMITWHKIEQHNAVASDEKATEITVNFGKFWKCGFYDWRLMEMTPAGKLQPVMLTKPPLLHSTSTTRPDSEFDNHHNDQIIAQGRYIVHP